MRVELVTPGYARHTGGLERRVGALASGLARRGLQVEVLTQDYERGLPSVSELEGVVVRRFAAPISDQRVAVAPRLWDHLRRTARTFGVVHVHGADAPLGLAVLRARPARLVITPHFAPERLLRWPYTHLTRAMVDRAAGVVCTSDTQAESLRGAFPWASARIQVVPDGADVAAIRSTRPFRREGTVVLAVGRLERYKRVDRAIAAMAGLGRTFELVVVGHGPARRRLEAYASDLQVASRVRFVGRVSDADLYRWLRTASALVSLAEQPTSGLEVIEAAAAGVPVVASDTAAHREAASYSGGAGVKFVSTGASPLEVADAISSASRTADRARGPTRVPSWDTVVAQTCGLYEELIARRSPGRRGEPDF
jgi:glycosyltransferase involved in cell wall biosynthesis